MSPDTITPAQILAVPMTEPECIFSDASRMQPDQYALNLVLHIWIR
jgi:hypothetical protein